MALDMTTALTIRAKVDGLNQIQGLDKALGATTTKANGLAGAFGKLRAAASSMVGVLGAAGLGAVLKKSVDTFGQFQAETKLLENGLKNVGAQTGELERLQKVASDLGEATLFNEEDFRRGFGLLTSFGNIGTESYDRVAKAAADVARTSGTDVSSAFMQLAKALNDPIAGLSALSRSGIQFSESQKEVIKQLVETGQTAKAQELILAELEKQYGGNAAAAAQGLAGAFDTLNEKFYDLQVALGDNVTVVLQPLIQGLTSLVGFITSLPEPVQTLIVALSGLVVAAGALGAAIAIGGPIFTALAGIVPLLTGIPALIAGWAGAIGPLVAGLGTLGQILVGVFSGPVGWVALAAAAGVAIYAFRDQIGQAFQAIGQTISTVAGAFKSVFIDPIIALGQQLIQFFTNSWNQLGQILQAPFQQGIEWLNANFIEPFLGFGQQVIDFYSNTWTGIFEFLKQPFEQGWQFIQENFIAPVQQAITQAIEFIKTGWSGLQEIITAPFTAAIGTIRAAFNGIITLIENGINGAVKGINALIAGANRVPGVNIPAVSEVKLPRFAEGGVVTGPTMALVGEGGEPEYIVPQSKAGKFAANWMAGVRGPAAIPRFADGGMVVPSANVSIQTGPVTQMNGANYVTTQDLTRAVQAGVNQTLNLIAGDGGVRRQLGIA